MSQKAFLKSLFKLKFCFLAILNIKITLNIKVVVNRTDFYPVIMRIAIALGNNHAKFNSSPALIWRKRHRFVGVSAKIKV